jgi:hypothetical protein
MKLVQILVDGTMNDINLNKVTKTNILKKMEDLSHLKEGKLKEICSWNINDIHITCYGYLKGINENNHVIMKNMTYKNEAYTDCKLYGDIFIVKYNKTKVSDIDVADYALIYNIEEDESDYEEEGVVVDGGGDEDEYGDFCEYTDEEGGIENKDNDEIVETNIKLPKKNINIIDELELDIDNNIYKI